MLSEAIASGVQPRLFILEDEGLVAEDIRSTLSRAGFDVVGVTDRGDTAISSAVSLRPDLVLCDINVRGPLDGIDVAERLHAADIPVVFVTAFADAGMLQRAGAVAPYGYVVKPFHEPELIATVTVALTRRRAEARTRAMEQWLTTTLGSIGDAVIATDARGHVSFINLTAELLTGWTRGSALGRALGDVFAVFREGDPEPVQDLFQRVAGSGVVFHLTREFELRTFSGARVPIHDSIAPIRRHDGQIDGLVVVFRDRTHEKRAAEERARAEKRLQEAQRLESLGVLAGGIAHDFNNLLAVILGNATLARDELPPDAPHHEYLNAVERAATTAASLCASMLAYAGKGHHKRIVLDLNAFLEETVNLLRVSMPPNVRLALDLDGRLPTLIADASQLQQVMMNLLLNASEAIGAGRGTVTVRTTSLALDQTALLSMHVGGLSPGRYAWIEVKDDGPGMPTEVIEHIFDPFFTTKVFGRGLGLSAVRGIVEQHDGAITVESVVGIGTVFRMLLPLPAAPPSLPSVQSRPPVQRWTGRVLVVDDEAGVRDSLSAILLRLGFQVDAFERGSDALAFFTSQPTSFQLVVTDLSMPEMDGLELLGHLRELVSSVPIVVTTGWSESETFELVSAMHQVALLAKPFSVDTVRRVITDLLNPERASGAHGT